MKDFKAVTNRDYFIETDHLKPIRYVYHGTTYYGMMYVTITGTKKEQNYFIMNNNGHNRKDRSRNCYEIDYDVRKAHGYDSVVHISNGTSNEVHDLDIHNVSIGAKVEKPVTRRRAPAKTAASAEIDAVKSVRFVLPKEAPLVFKTQTEVTFKKS